MVLALRTADQSRKDHVEYWTENEHERRESLSQKCYGHLAVDFTSTSVGDLRSLVAYMKPYANAEVADNAVDDE